MEERVLGRKKMPRKKKKVAKMHRAYQSVTPANNIYLKHRWDEEIFSMHRKKVEAAKAVIDNNPPKTYMHLHIKLKKLQEHKVLAEAEGKIDLNTILNGDLNLSYDSNVEIFKGVQKYILSSKRF